MVHCRNWLENSLPDKCAQLMILDPPYFEVKGEFDFVWESFDDYLKDVEVWARECKRLLADNGTLFWWGDKRRIAYIQVILDRFFHLENSLMWRKIDSMQIQYYSPSTARVFNNHNERLLMYSNEVIMTGLEAIYADPELFKPIKLYFDQWLQQSGLTLKRAVETIGSSCTHWFGFSTREKTQFSFPTREKWEKMELQHPHFISYEQLREQYDEMLEQYKGIREGYESKRRYFYNELKLEEVLEFSQEANITREYDHPTQKPESLSRALILACSRPGDLVVVPFAGSGTECAMAAKEKRRFVGYDLAPEYVEMSNVRAAKYSDDLTLF